MSGATLPAAIWTDTITVAGRTLRVHVLDDGRRLIDATDMQSLVADLEAGRAKVTPADLQAVRDRLMRGGAA